MSRTTQLAPHELPAAAAAPDLVVEGRGLQGELRTSAGPVTLGMRRMAGRWLATASGPHGQTEVGVDRSPYIAAQLAMERWQPDMVSVMLAVGEMTRSGPRRADQASE